MDNMRFDRWTRGFEARISRRHLSGIAAAGLVALGLGVDVEAKKKKRKKKKKKPAAPPVSYSCGNLGTACGNTAICQCRLSKSSQQVCLNTVTPPNGISFPPCQTNANCGSGQFCDLQFSQCALGCRT